MSVLVIASALEVRLAAAVASAQIARVSEAADGTQANGDSGPAVAMSGNGRYVAFASAATNLVSGDTNGSNDVFVKDRQTGAIVRVSVAGDGTERTGDSGLEGVDISDDGQIVVFTSRAALAADDTNTCTPAPAAGAGPSCPDVYLHDRGTGQTQRLSVGGGGVEANGPSRHPALSADGRFVVFSSEASNLIAGDLNGAADVFLRDRVGLVTSRISVTSTGAEVQGTSHSPLVSDDGGVVAFLSDASAASFGLAADPLACPGDGTPCMRGYYRVPSTGVTTRMPTTSPHPEVGRTVEIIAMSSDGRVMAAKLRRVTHPFDYIPLQGGVLFDRLTGESLPPPGSRAAEVISGDGRHVGGRLDPFGLDPTNQLVIRDRVTTFDSYSNADNSILLAPKLSSTGQFLLFSGRAPSHPSTVQGVFVFDRDRDGDGMFDYWESMYGLDADNATDAALDPDGDGQTSLQEFNAAGHPTGAHTYYFAEGAESAFMQTRFAVVNLGAARARFRMRYQGSDGRNAFEFRSLDPSTQTVVASPPPGDFATLVESDQPLIMNRQMIWGDSVQARYLGSHMESALAGPSTTWYLAEGATHGGFDLFYLLQNPGDVQAQVSVEYLRPAPLPPIVKTYPVDPRTRRTIWVDSEGPELAETDVSATITSDQPLVVERAMYYSTPEQSFLAGHAGAGVTAPAPRWFVAEGATGAFFDFYVLIANPGNVNAALTVTYLLHDGPPITKTYTAAARSRLTIDVKGEDPRLASADVSTIVESTNGQPVIVERALWWPSGQWYEAHLSAGATSTGTKWGFAGEIEHRSARSDMYLLIANTSNTAGTATIKILPSGTTTPNEIIVPLPANSRVTVQTTSWFPPLAPNEFRGSFGGTVEADVPIVVEQANYVNSSGRVWELGSSALATKIQ